MIMRPGGLVYHSVRFHQVRMGGAINKSRIVLVVCAVLAIAFFGSQWGPWLSGGEWNAEAFYYPAWVGAPYFIGLVLNLALRLTAKAQVLISVVSVMCLVVGSIYLYFEAVRQTETLSGIWFLIVPFFQILAIVISVVVGKVISIAQNENDA